jgi:acyl carrier protein
MPPELKEILQNVLEVDSISERDTPETIASWDSVRHLNLIAAIEERFNILFEADDLLEMTTVEAIVAAVGRRTSRV